MKIKITLLCSLLSFALISTGQASRSQDSDSILRAHVKKHKNDALQKFTYEDFSKGDKFQNISFLKSSEATVEILDSILTLNYVHYLNDWEIQKKDRFVYDKEKNIFYHYEYENEGDNGKWICIERISYEYNNDNNLIVRSFADFDTDNNVWITSWIELYQYNNDGLCIEQHDYELRFGNMKLEECSAKYYTYSEGKLTADSTATLDEYTRIWKPYQKIYYYYNTDGKLNNFEIYHNSAGSFYLESKGEKFYDENGNDTLCVKYVFDLNSELIPSSTIKMRFDSEGNMTERILNFCDIYSGEWNFGYKYTVDFEHSDTEKIIRPVLWWEETTPIIGDGKVVEIRTYYDNPEEYNKKKQFYYSDYAKTNITDTKASSIEIYPNPVSDFLRISLPEDTVNTTLILTDELGRKVLQKSLNASAEIDIHHLQKGCYTYKISGKETIVSGTIIKK